MPSSSGSTDPASSRLPIDSCSTASPPRTWSRRPSSRPSARWSASSPARRLPPGSTRSRSGLPPAPRAASEPGRRSHRCARLPRRWLRRVEPERRSPWARRPRRYEPWHRPTRLRGSRRPSTRRVRRDRRAPVQVPRRGRAPARDGPRLRGGRSRARPAAQHVQEPPSPGNEAPPRGVGGRARRPAPSLDGLRTGASGSARRDSARSSVSRDIRPVPERIARLTDRRPTRHRQDADARCNFPALRGHS